MKKAFYVLSVLLLSAGLTACGGEATQEPEETSVESNVSEESEAVIEEEEEESATETEEEPIDEIESSEIAEKLDGSLIGTWMTAEDDNYLYMSFTEDGVMDVWATDADNFELDRMTGTYTAEDGKLDSDLFGEGTTIFYAFDGDKLTLENPDLPDQKYVLSKKDSGDFNIPEYTAADLVGTWIQTNSSEAYITMTFNEDGTIDAKASTADGVELERMTDTFTIEGNEITISYPNGKDDETFYIAINGDILKMAYVTQPDVIFEYLKQ